MTPSPPGIPEEDYEAIEAAVMETARGRWFLMEFMRRNRNADTKVLLEAISRLEHQMGSGKYLPPSPHQPVTDGAVVTAASAELFAVEPAPPVTAVTLPALAEQPELAWVEEPDVQIDPTRAIQADIFHFDDDLIVPTHETVMAPAPARLAPPAAFAPPPAPVSAPAPAAAPPAPPPVAAAPPAASAEAPISSAPAQSRMLAGALASAGAFAHAEATLARASEPAPPPPPTAFSPPPAEPLELDALSFEEKSVYFG